MKQLGNEYFMMEAYQNNIMIASTNGFFRTAKYYYDKCHELVRGKDEYEEAMIYNGVGYISSAMEEYEKAFECYNRALKSFLKMEKIKQIKCPDLPGAHVLSAAELNKFRIPDRHSIRPKQ